MDELVYLKNDEAVCSSLDVAEKFGKRHDKLISEIERMYGDLIGKGCPQNGGDPLFKKTTYTHPQNMQTYPMYLMNRDGFSLLVMGFTGKKALEWKLQYIKAFNTMEKFIREKTSEAWIETRKNGRITRRAETDVIKQLVEYAKCQGSEHAQMLYVTYSKLANKMAGIKDRELATIQQLSKLSFIENIILNQIRVGMERNLHYKEIYKDCKKQIELFKNIAYLEQAV